MKKVLRGLGLYNDSRHDTMWETLEDRYFFILQCYDRERESKEVLPSNPERTLTTIEVALV